MKYNGHLNVSKFLLLISYKSNYFIRLDIFCRTDIHTNFHLWPTQISFSHTVKFVRIKEAMLLPTHYKIIVKKFLFLNNNYDIHYGFTGSLL
jgi:hypothetical protein